MPYRLLADVVVIFHFLFVLFVIFGGLLVLWRRWAAFFHIPAVLWAVFIEFSGRICPLTPLEIWLRQQGGGSGYRTGFVEHYIIPLLYPVGLTRHLQVILGSLVAIINPGIYAWVVYHLRRRRKSSGR